MTINLKLDPELERRLREEAQLRGISPQEFALNLIEKHLPPSEHRKKIATLLQSWIDEGDVQEQRETGEYLARVLDEDRPSARKLFPPELRDVTR